MVWSNTPRKVYHGTTDRLAGAIFDTGVNPAAGRTTADFGQGFYVTSDFHQAQQWANRKARNQPKAIVRAAVLSFLLDRDRIGALGDHLAFVLADDDFHDFVTFNRFGSKSHARSGGHAYDVVYGPVSAFPQRLTFASCDQICFVAAGPRVSMSIQALGAPRDVVYGTPFF